MTLTSKSALNRAIESIRAIESTTYPWQDVLQTTQAVIGADAGCFMAWNRRTGELQSFVQQGHDSSTEKDYVSNYYRIDVVAQKAQNLPVGQWLSSHCIMSPAQWKREEFYADFLRRHRIGHIFGFALANDVDNFAAFAFQCQSENRDLSRLVCTRQIVGLSRQMQSAYHRRFRAAGQSIEAITDVLDPEAESVCFVGFNGRLDHYSPRDHPNLSGKYRLRVHANALEHGEPTSNQQLVSTINAVLRDSRRRRIVLAESWGRVHKITLSPITRPISSGAEPCVVAHVELCDIFKTIAEEVPTRLFDLTPAEARILVLLFAGHDATECAILQQVALGTVRKQIAAILKKTGCHRQGELMRVCSMALT